MTPSYLTALPTFEILSQMWLISDLDIEVSGTASDNASIFNLYPSKFPREALTKVTVFGPIQQVIICNEVLG